MATSPDASNALAAGSAPCRVGDVYLDAAQIRARVGELAAEIAADYRGRDLLLVGLLKASVPFVVDLSRALRVPHALDFVELAGYGRDGGHAARLLKDLDTDIAGRDVLLVEDVVDTGLTLHYLVRVLRLRRPASLAAVTLLDRPYRRLAEDIPVRYSGFTVPDEFFVGYGFDLHERYRNLRDLHLLVPSAPPLGDAAPVKLRSV